MNGEESGEQRAIANKVGASREQGTESHVAETSDIQYGVIKDEALRVLLERLEKHIAEKEKNIFEDDR